MDKWLIAICIVLLCSFATDCHTAGLAQSISCVDELSYVQYLVGHRPELLSQTNMCYTTLLFKPRYRSAIMGGSDVNSYMREHYLSEQREEDRRWVAAQQQMEGAIQNRLPSNVSVAGYNPAQFVGYLNNNPTRFSDENG